MRWFTDEAYEAWGDDDEESWDAMLAAYNAHVAEIAAGLPPDLHALATEPRLHLHDARFISVVVDRGAETIEMVLALFDDDERALRLTFGEASFVEENIQRIAHAVGGSFTTDHWGSMRTIVMAQEIDVADDGRFVLRLRLYPFHEFGPTFRSFSLVEEAAPPDEGQPGALTFADEPDDD